MKNIILLLLIIGPLLFFGCKKDDPVIADINELSTLALSESFICQPVTYANNLVAIINKDDTAILCSYDMNGNKSWQQNLQAYTLNGLTPNDVEFLDLQKDAQNQLVINMYQPIFNNNQQLVNQYIKAIKFSETGQFLWQLTDNIHQPDTIIIGLDTIDVIANNDFEAADLLSFSDGTYAVISSQVSRTVDSTFIQLTSYNNNGQFTGDRYLKLPDRWKIVESYITSDDNLFLFAGSTLDGRGFKMINLQGNIIFELNPNSAIFETYFFYETSQGNYIISAAFFKDSDVAHGIVFCLNKSGETLWSLPSTLTPGSGFMHSVNEQADGYLFSGLNSSSALFDWKNGISNADYHAVLLKTDLNGIQQWEKVITSNLNSAGAGTLGSSDFSFFLEKKDEEGTIKNITLLKFDQEGNLKN